MGLASWRFVTFLNARSAPFSVSSASAFFAASRKRLYCAESSGFKRRVFSIDLSAFFTGPILFCPLTTLIAQKTALIFKPPSTFAAKRTCLGRHRFKRIFERSNSFLQGGEFLAILKDRIGLCPNPICDRLSCACFYRCHHG